MSDKRSTKELFKEWRGGDAEAGQLMAQRFADWYYAIATSRLGESGGRAPCESSCAEFGAGIVTVTDSRALVGWAHDIVKKEMSQQPIQRITDGDEPCAYTGNQQPKGLLVRAAQAHPIEVKLLEACYSNAKTDAEIQTIAEPMGGYPLGVLKARYKVKQWLRDNANVPFEVAPDDPILDRAPLPLYESGRMATAAEEANFEQWMLSDIGLCRDIAEFAHFAIALRGGLPSAEELAAQHKAAAAAPAPSAGADAPAAGGNAGGLAALGGVAVLGIGLLVVLLIVASVAAYFLL